MWIPVLVFAHVFALFWLVKTLLVINPLFALRVKKLFGFTAKNGGAGKQLLQRESDPESGSRRSSDDAPPAGASDQDGAAQDALRRLTSVMAPIQLEWQEVGCSYMTARGPISVLRGVYGRVVPQEMLALMGPSGSGKSTLLDILAMRKSVGNLEGAILVNGKPRDKSFVSKTAYVPQDDVLLPSMTVLETMTQYGNLILRSRMSAKDKRARIQEVLQVVGLADHQDTLVGGYLPGGILLRGLSGGERKRLSVAAGIIALPSVIFLDEPTSGLDSYAALNVMQYMRKMADWGHIVIASIHQPRSAIWNLFDKVLMLSGGRMMYFGNRVDMMSWFSHELGFPYQPALQGLVSDWAMDLINIGFKKPKRYFGRMMTTPQELEVASLKFRKQYLVQEGLWGEEEEEQLRKRIGDAADGPMVERSASMMTALSDVRSAVNSCHSFHSIETSASLALAQGRRDSVGRRDTVERKDTLRKNTLPLFQEGEATEAGDVQYWAKWAKDSLAAGAETREQQAHEALGDRDGIEMVQSDIQLPDIAHIEKVVEKHQKRKKWGKKLLSKPDEKKAKRRQASWATQFRVLLWRQYLAITRNPADVAGRMLIFAWVALFCGLVWYDLSEDVTVSLRATMSCLFVSLTIFMLLPYVYMSVYTSEKQYYLADLAAKLYQPSAYYLAKQVVYLSFAIVNALVFGLIVYGLVGLRDRGSSIMINAFCGVMLYLTASQVVDCAAMVAPNQDTAFVLSIAWTALQLLLSNFLVRYQDMNIKWVSYLRYVSALSFAWGGASNAEYKGRQFNCSGGLPSDVIQEIPAFIPNSTSLLRTVSPFLSRPPGGCMIEGESVLRHYGLTLSFWQTALILLGYYGVVQVVSYICFYVVSRKERR